MSNIINKVVYTSNKSIVFPCGIIISYDKLKHKYIPTGPMELYLGDRPLMSLKYHNVFTIDLFNMYLSNAPNYVPYFDTYENHRDEQTSRCAFEVCHDYFDKMITIYANSGAMKKFGKDLVYEVDIYTSQIVRTIGKNYTLIYNHGRPVSKQYHSTNKIINFNKNKFTLNQTHSRIVEQLPHMTKTYELESNNIPVDINRYIHHLPCTPIVTKPFAIKVTVDFKDDYGNCGKNEYRIDYTYVPRKNAMTLMVTYYVNSVMVNGRIDPNAPKYVVTSSDVKCTNGKIITMENCVVRFENDNIFEGVCTVHDDKYIMLKTGVLKTTTDVKYAGMFIDNKLNGNDSVIVFANNTIFNGFVRDNKAHLYGIFHYTYKDSIECFLFNGKKKVDISTHAPPIPTQEFGRIRVNRIKKLSSNVVYKYY